MSKKKYLFNIVGLGIIVFSHMTNAQTKKDTTMTPITCGQHIANHADISKSQFLDVNMAEVKFDDVNLSKSHFNNINMSKVVFHGINMSDIEISFAELSGAKFKHISAPTNSKQKQRPISFEDVDLNSSKYYKCDLSNSTIDSCNIEGMKINGIAVSDMLKAYREKKK